MLRLAMRSLFRLPVIQRTFFHAVLRCTILAHTTSPNSHLRNPIACPRSNRKQTTKETGNAFISLYGQYDGENIVLVHNLLEPCGFFMYRQVFRFTCPHLPNSVLLFFYNVLYESQNQKRLFPYTLTDSFFRTDGAYAVRYEMDFMAFVFKGLIMHHAIGPYKEKV